ncbi:hypothetical protein ACX1IS_14440 [Yersinia enterocolitica]
MTSIFYPLPSNVLTNVFPLQKNTHDENEIFNIKIGEETFFLEKKGGINTVFDDLYKSGWINSVENHQDTNLYSLLSFSAETSLAEKMISFDNRLKYDLALGDTPTCCFESNGQSGVKMHYEVTHSDGVCSLFKLKCEFLFDKNCQLSHEKNFIFIEFFPQCHQELIDILDERTVMQVFLEWLKNLFHLNVFAFENTRSVEAMGKNIEVRLSKEDINQDKKVQKTDGESYDEIEQMITELSEDLNQGKEVIDENYFYQSFESTFNALDSLADNISQELEECSDNKIERIVTEFSDRLEKDRSSWEQKIEEIVNDSIQINKELEKSTNRLNGIINPNLEWDDVYG